MRVNPAKKTLQMLLIAAVAFMPSRMLAAADIDLTYRQAMEAYKGERWELANRLAAQALSQIESAGWKDWIYHGERKPFMAYFTSDLIYMATSDDDERGNMNKVQIYDPVRDELVRIYDFTPWEIFGSTHSPDYTVTYLNRDQYLGYRIVWFEKGKPEGERSILREGIENVDCHRLIDSNVFELLEKGRAGWSLSILDLSSGEFREIHDFEKIDITKDIWKQYKVVKDPKRWKFINANKIYSLKVGEWDKELLYTLPFDISPYDNFNNKFTEKLIAVRSDTLFFLRPTSDTEFELRTIRLPFPLQINHVTKRIDIDNHGEWFAQSDTDSLRVFKITGNSAKMVLSEPSCVGGTFPLHTNTFWKGDTLVHYGNSGLKIFKGSDPIHVLDAEDTYVEYYRQIEKFVIYEAPGEFSVFDLRNLKTLWRKQYNIAHITVKGHDWAAFDNTKNKYLVINHVDGTSLHEIETGEEVLQIREVATLNRVANHDTTKIIIQGENVLGVYEISNREKLKRDLIGVSACSKWEMADTSGALQEAREALSSGTNLSGDLTEKLLDILSDLGLQKESARLIGNMAIKTRGEEWINKLKSSGVEVLIEPYLADYLGIIAFDEGVFAIPLIIYPFSVAKGEERTCYWFGRPDYEAEKRMLPIAGLTIAGQQICFFEYHESASGERLNWSPLLITESGEFKKLGKLMETKIERANPSKQFYADYLAYFPVDASSKKRALTNITLTNHTIGKTNFTVGIDLTGEGKNWYDTTTVDPVRIGNRYYAHSKYGELICGVAEGSQADSIGIEFGDIVISFGGIKEMNTTWINRTKTYYPDRAPLEFIVLRGGDTLSFTVLNGMIGIDVAGCHNLVEIDPETGDHRSVKSLPSGYHFAAANSSGELAYTFEDTLLFLNPISLKHKKVPIEGLEGFYRIFDVPRKDVLLLIKLFAGEFLALDLSKTADDADRVLWKQTFENIYRIGSEPRICFSDDEDIFPVLLDDGTLLIIDIVTGSTLSRETLPFKNFGFIPWIWKGTLYGVNASWIFGWKVAYYHPPFPWRYMGYGASAIVPLFLLSLVFNRVRVERLKRKQADELKRAQTDAEISAARKLQANLIPTGLHELGEFQLLGKFVPASEVAGDYFDFHLLDDGRLVVVMGDVSGHGLPAGILVSMAKASLMTVRRRNGDFKDTLESLNEVVRNGSPDKEMLMTLCYLVLDPDKKKVSCSANGHPYPLIAKKDGTVLEIGSEGGYPLGVRDKQEFRIVESDFDRGDTLLLFTDGIPEQIDPAGEPWGYENFMRAFSDLSGRPDIEAVVNGLLDRALEYSGGVLREDDMALVAIRYNLDRF